MDHCQAPSAMPPTSIDPREFGRLEAEVEQLKDLVQAQGKKIDKLLELANQSKGGFWAGMTIASFLGGFVTFLVSTFWHR